MATIKGICKNIDNCSKAENREIQEVEKSLPFICEECEKPLQEIINKEKKKKHLLMCMILLTFVTFGGTTLYFCRSSFSPSDSNTNPFPPVQPEPEVITAIQPKSTETQSIDLPEDKKQTSLKSNQLDLGYAVWSGEIKNNLPHAAKGTMTFKTRHLIESRDEKKRTASPGDYIIGEYVDGHLVQGRWFNLNGELIGNIIVGLP